MKIICVGMNYRAHNVELGVTELPADPVLFLKADSALHKSRTPFFIPDFSSRIEYETELVVRISRVGKHIAPRFAHRYYEEVTVGLDLTARDLQNELRAKGLPWEVSKSFDGSAVVGEWVELGDRKIQEMTLRLDRNGTTIQQGSTAAMVHPVDALIAYASRFFTLKMGDLIFTGTPAGVGPIECDDHLEAYLDDQKLLDLKIK